MSETVNPDQSVTMWIKAAKFGDPQAAQLLFERYFGRLVDLSKHMVKRKLRVEDGEDAAIETMNSFLTGIANGKYPDIQDRNSLWPLLVDVVVKNSKKQLRKQKTERRSDLDVSGESVFLLDPQGKLGIDDFAIEKLSHQDAIELCDIVDHLRSLLSQDDRAIFDLKLLQHSNREVAKILERPTRSIDRKLNNVILPLLQNLLAQ